MNENIENKNLEELDEAPVFTLTDEETGEEKVILFNLSGHGLIDMAAYDQFLAGNIH